MRKLLVLLVLGFTIACGNPTRTVTVTTPEGTTVMTRGENMSEWQVKLDELGVKADGTEIANRAIKSNWRIAKHKGRFIREYIHLDSTITEYSHKHETLEDAEEALNRQWKRAVKSYQDNLIDGSYDKQIVVKTFK